ncbi:MAG: rod shape-determining protein MreC [Bacteroidetes bacterium]|nr:rod shape-determining protein MreC [Bacteroidota bacterium]
MLERVFHIFTLYKEYVVLSCCIILSLTLLTTNDSPQIKRIRSVVSVGFGIVQEYVSFVPQYFSLRSENALLRRKNIALADEANRLREAKLENYRLRRMLEFKERATFPMKAAFVVSKDLLLLRNTITINVGYNDGIREQMPVVNEDGLVGLVTHVSANYALVTILLNTSLRVSGKIQRSRVDGIIQWDGSVLLFENVPRTRDVQVGDVIVTSGYSQFFVPNIRIGVVRELGDQPGSLFKKIVVTPAVDFVKLEEVFVILGHANEEQLNLESSVRGVLSQTRSK